MGKRTTILLAIIWLQAGPGYLGSTETPSRSEEAEKLAFKATNEARVRNSLPPFIWDQRLSDIAYAHAADMIVREFFDHVNPDGLGPAERIHRQHRQFIGNTGENVSVIVGSPPPDATTIAERAMAGWLRSPPHLRNIQDRAFTHVGIGVALQGVEAKVAQVFMQVRGVLKEPLPESLRRQEPLRLEVVSFPAKSTKAKNYILAPISPAPDEADPAVWPLSATFPSVPPGRYTVQFCFPTRDSRFFEVFPGPQIEIEK